MRQIAPFLSFFFGAACPDPPSTIVNQHSRANYASGDRFTNDLSAKKFVSSFLRTVCVSQTPSTYEILKDFAKIFLNIVVTLRSGLKAPAEPSRAELPTRRVKFLFSKTSSEEINHKYFLYKIIT